MKEIKGNEFEMQAGNQSNNSMGPGIAIIGLAGRFPGANSISEFWENLKNGVEPVSFLSDEELAEAGVSLDLVKDPNYVKTRGGVLEDKELFDASFFGYSPGEAKLLNPQVRTFMECVWVVLEDAGYNPISYSGLIGLYAGATPGFNWEIRSHLSGKSEAWERYAANLLVRDSYLCSQVAYRLNLKGPCFNVQTACSTSLVAVHVGCQSLLSGECDIALAGGVTVSDGNRAGYLYREGLIFSPDGHCRAFDAAAKGTYSSEGVGVAALKLVEDAVRDGDQIYAVIKGTAINNDGNQKVGFTAPSIFGQVAVIKEAMAMAEVAPETIGYVEAHGTGTVLGDPVELEALKLAYNLDKKGVCAIGSVKSNFGHLDNAAGIAGLIKTVLALTHRQIPPSLHFQRPNPEIDLENSPFYVNNRLAEWKSHGLPLRAGITSLGIGGTNVHVILQEARGREASPPGRPHQLILLSAKTGSALENKAKSLGEYFKKNPSTCIADASYTLKVGRQMSQYRGMLVCCDAGEAIEALTSPDLEKFTTGYCRKDNPGVVFMFPGQGAQYVNMGLDLYQTELFFRKQMDRCFEILESLMDYNIKDILYPSPGISSNKSYISPETINRTEITQPVIFIFEYALAKLLMKWGIKPYAMIGHSIGEYVAACLAGVFSLNDALTLVVLRGKLMQEIPPGAMLGVPLPEKEIKLLLNNEISLAAVNSPSNCVVSGPFAAIDTFEKLLVGRGIKTRRLHTSHAFHSKMMNPVLEKFKEKIKGIKFNNPEMPYISNLTGNWITPGEAIAPSYWAKHLGSTVQFSRGIEKLLKLKDRDMVLVEVGPAKTLSTFARQHIQTGKKNHPPLIHVLNLVRHPQEHAPDDYFLLRKIGHLWLYGINTDWTEFYAGEKRYRIPLPAYPFEGRRYWSAGDCARIEMKTLSQKPQLNERKKLADFFYLPSWKRINPIVHKKRKALGPSKWLIFLDECGFGSLLKQELIEEAADVTTVSVGENFIQLSRHQYTINPQNDSDYEILFNELYANGRFPGFIVHLWSISNNEPKELDINRVDGALELGYYSLLNTAKAIGKSNVKDHVHIWSVTNNMQEVTGNDQIYPEKATVLGPVNVIPNEYANISCSSIDFSLYPSESIQETLIRQLLDLFALKSFETVIALRGVHIWVQRYEPIYFENLPEDGSRLKQEGVYLITGGLGGIGLLLAEYLAKNVRAKLVLTGRSQFPSKDLWDQWLVEHSEDDPVSRKIEKVRELEKCGAGVLVCSADVSSQLQMEEVVCRAIGHFGHIDGVIHSAGIIDGEMIPGRKREKSENLFAAKIKGTLVLDKILRDLEPDFFVLCSSLASILTGVGEIGYCAANNFLDAFAGYRFYSGNTSITSINWERWQHTGMAAAGEKLYKQVTGSELTGGLPPPQGVEAFSRILKHTLPQVVVSASDLNIENHRLIGPKTPSSREEPGKHPGQETLPVGHRQELDRQEVEQTLIDIWSDFFGIEDIGINDNFFELGGDSLKMMTILFKVHKQLGVEISIPEFFSRPTIKELFEYIGNNSPKNNYLSIEPTEEKEYYVLSSAQKRLFFLQQMEINNKSYNQPNILILEGILDKTRLKRIFRELIQRHESLRTSFDLVEDKPVQKILPPHNVQFEIDYFEAEAEVKPGVCSAKNPGSLLDMEEAVSNFVRPFDLSLAPLLRIGLIKKGKELHILMLDIHHVVSDGTSIGVLTTEFMKLYEGKELPPLTVRYKDYAEWRNSEKEIEKIKTQEAYWLNLFKGENPEITLPTDYARPLMMGFKGGNLDFTISREESSRLKELARKEEVSVFMLLLAIFNTLLAKASGDEDIVIGTGVEGRRHEDIKQVVGMFVNTLPLRNFPGSNKTFREFLGELKKNTLEAFDNQDYQFEDIVDKVVTRRNTAKNPLFSVMFQFENYELPELKITGLTLKPYRGSGDNCKFDLILWGGESSGTFWFSFQYSTELFKRETIHTFINYFKEITSAVINDPDKKLWEIKRISEQSKQEMLRQLNRQPEAENSRTGGRRQVLQHRLNESTEKFEDKIAIEYGESLLTYGELAKRSNRVAGRIIVKGIKKGTFIGVLLEDRVEIIITAIGILESGCVFVPLDSTSPMHRLNVMVESTGIKLIIVDKVNSSSFDAGDSIKRGGPELLPIEEWFEGEIPLLPAAAHIRSQPEDKIYIYFTSGSTGVPKAILGKNSSLVQFLDWETDTFAIDDNFRFSQLTTPVFDAFLRDVFTPLCCGAVVCIPESKEILTNATELVKWLERSHIYLTSCVPGIFRLINSVPLTHGNFKNLEVILLSGEKITPSDLDRWFDIFDKRIKLVNLWGTSETTLAKTFHPIGKTDLERERIPVGKPIRGAAIMVLDNNLEMCDPLVTGELYIRTSSRSFGYINDPQSNKERFIRNPFTDDPDDLIHKTGDRGRMLTDGTIDLLGRNDRQVKIRGIRVELEEIESILIKHPLTVEAVVIKKQVSNNELLCAYVTGKEKNGTDEASLRFILEEYLLTKLPGYMVPSRIKVLDKLPRTSNGKVDYKKLPEPFTGSENRGGFPIDRVEKRLLELWSGILALPMSKISTKARFFELGGNSLNIMALLSKIHREFDIQIPLGEIFNNPTIQMQANIIRKADKDKFVSINAAEKREYYALSPAQRRLYVIQSMDSKFIAFNMTTTAVVEGNVNIDRLAEAFRQLIKRHESLRTSFGMIGAEIIQRGHDEVEPEIDNFEAANMNPLTTGESSGNNSRESSATVDKIINGFIRPFFLQRAPLLRVGLIRTAGQRGLLIADMHHIISDGVSQAILIRDFISLYQGETLPALRLQYKDYSQWQNNEQTRSTEMKMQEKYWLKQFEGEIPELKMPTDFSNSTLKNSNVENLDFTIKTPLYREMEKFTSDTTITPYMILLATFNILISKYSRQEDIVIGSPVTGRNHPDLENIIGMFVNMLALRNRPKGEKTVREFLEEVKENTLNGIENQSYQFDELVKKLGLQGTTRKNPLFEAVFNMLNIEHEKDGNDCDTIGDLKVYPYRQSKYQSQFNLMLVAREGDDRINLKLVFSTAHFKRKTIEKMTKYYMEIIEQVIGEHHIRLADVKLSHDLFALKSNPLRNDNTGFDL